MAPLPSSTHPTSQQKVLVWLISTQPKLAASRALPHHRALPSSPARGSGPAEQPRHVPSSQRRTFSSSSHLLAQGTLPAVPSASAASHGLFLPPGHHTGWAPGVCRVQPPGPLLLTSTPRPTQPFAWAPSLSRSLTQATSTVQDLSPEQSPHRPHQQRGTSTVTHSKSKHPPTLLEGAAQVLVMGETGPLVRQGWAARARGETCSLTPRRSSSQTLLLPPRGERPCPCLSQGSPCSPQLG